MRVLITGCNGQVGYYLTEQLKNKLDVKLLALDRNSLDITDEAAVKAIVRDFKPSVIINAAAHTAVDKAEEEIDLSYAINRDGPKYLAEAAQKLDALIVHISTDYVFSGDKIGEYHEDDVTGPLSIYGESKLAGEKAIQVACSKYIILRTAWVFGGHGNDFVKTMLRLAADRDELSIIGDQFGGPTYAGDVAAALIEIATQVHKNNSIRYGIYHFSGFPYVSWFGFAQAIFHEAKELNILNKIPKVSNITTEQYPTAAKRPANSKLATGKISEYFGIKASDWQEKLANIVLFTK